MSDFSAFNEVYRGYFKNKPARTTFAASGLARNAKVEIACVAIKK
jgi:2-iminobutanoate/2-iminopropanoate deaminase